MSHISLWRLLIVVFVLDFSHFVYALPPKPDHCPVTTELQIVGFTHAKKFAEDGDYLAYHLSNYHTKERWLFLMSVPGSDNEVDAIKTGNAIISHIFNYKGPELSQDKSFWGCFYLANYHLAFTMTPPNPQFPVLARRFKS